MSLKYRLVLVAAAAILPVATPYVAAVPIVFAAEKIDKGAFLKAVLSANKFEIDSSKLVLQKSASDDVTQGLVVGRTIECRIIEHCGTDVSVPNSIT